MVAWPANPSLGDTVTGPFAETYTWDGDKWSLTARGGNVDRSIEIGHNPPLSPLAGMLWFNTLSRKLFLYDGSQWVPSIGGVTNGSDAEPGEVGEYIFAATNVTKSASGWDEAATIVLPPGDWEVTTNTYVLGTASNLALIQTTDPNTAAGGDWNALTSAGSPGEGARRIAQFNVPSGFSNSSLNTGPMRWLSDQTQTIRLLLHLSVADTVYLKTSMMARRMR